VASAAVPAGEAGGVRARGLRRAGDARSQSEKPVPVGTRARAPVVDERVHLVRSDPVGIAGGYSDPEAAVGIPESRN